MRTFILKMAQFWQQATDGKRQEKIIIDYLQIGALISGLYNKRRDKYVWSAAV